MFFDLGNKFGKKFRFIVWIYDVYRVEYLKRWKEREFFNKVLYRLFVSLIFGLVLIWIVFYVGGLEVGLLWDEVFVG